LDLFNRAEEEGILESADYRCYKYGVESGYYKEILKDLFDYLYSHVLGEKIIKDILIEYGE